MCEVEDQKAEEEGAGDSRSVDCRRLVAERYTGDGDHNCTRYPRQCAVCKVIFAQRGECEHAIAHRQWNGDGGRHQAAEHVIGGQRPFHRDVVCAGPRTTLDLARIVVAFWIARKREHHARYYGDPRLTALERASIRLRHAREEHLESFAPPAKYSRVRWQWRFVLRSLDLSSRLRTPRPPPRSSGWARMALSGADMFATTVAGSLPKPLWLAEPEKLSPAWRLEGNALAAGKIDATILAVRRQEDAGIDIVRDGEQARVHFVHGFLANLDGVDFARRQTIGIRADRYRAEVTYVSWQDGSAMRSTGALRPGRGNDK